jgi:hypothetical protein
MSSTPCYGPAFAAFVKNVCPRWIKSNDLRAYENDETLQLLYWVFVAMQKSPLTVRLFARRHVRQALAKILPSEKQSELRKILAKLRPD